MANYDDQIKELQQERMDLQKQVGEVLKKRANLRAEPNFNIADEPFKTQLKGFHKDFSRISNGSAHSHGLC